VVVKQRSFRVVRSAGTCYEIFGGYYPLDLNTSTKYRLEYVLELRFLFCTEYVSVQVSFRCVFRRVATATRCGYISPSTSDSHNVRLDFLCETLAPNL